MDNPDNQGSRRIDRFTKETLSRIYDDYHLPIYRYIYRQVGDVEASRDLTTDVFQRLLETVKKQIRPIDNLQAWLYRTAHNAVIDYYRRQKHRQHLPLNLNRQIAPDDPASLAESNISADGVRLALNQLTPEQQQVITLKFLQGLSNKETAATLNKSIGAIKSLQHRALAALKCRFSSEKELES